MQILFAVALVGLAAPAAADDYKLLHILRPISTSADDHPPVVTAVAFHPTGRLLASAGDDHTIRIWDLDRGKTEVVLRGHQDWVRDVSFSADGTRLATVGADGKLFIWDLKNRRRYLALQSKHPLTSVALAPDGEHFVVTGFKNAIYTVDSKSRQTISRVTCSCQDLRMVRVSPDGQRLAVGGRDGYAYLWSTTTGQLIYEIPAHNRRIRAIAFSEDGKQLYTGSEDRAVCVWDLESGKKVMQLDTEVSKVLALCVLPGNLLAAAGSDNTIRIWNLKLRTEVSRIEGHTGSIAAMATDGKRLASSGFDTTVRIWALPDAAEVETANRSETPTER